MSGSPHALRLVFLGPPGAGKGTQAKLLEERFGVSQISTGDILRRHVSEETELGKEAKSYMDAGALVPDPIMMGMIGHQIDAMDAFILDGFPRTVAQAEALDELLARVGKPITQVIQFGVDHATLVRRLTGRWSNPRTGRVYHVEFNPPRVPGIDDEDGGPLVQRTDDTRGVVEKRLQIYAEQTAALKEYYRSRGLLHRIDAHAPIEDVTAAIVGNVALGDHVILSEGDSVMVSGAPGGRVVEPPPGRRP
jgi:adenylate kinase